MYDSYSGIGIDSGIVPSPVCLQAWEWNWKTPPGWFATTLNSGRNILFKDNVNYAFYMLQTLLLMSILFPCRNASVQLQNIPLASFVMVYTALDLSPVWICQEQSSSHGQHMGGRLVQLGSFLNLYFNSSLFTRFSVGLVCCSCPLNLFEKGFPSKMFLEEGNCLGDDH